MELAELWGDCGQHDLLSASGDGDGACCHRLRGHDPFADRPNYLPGSTVTINSVGFS